MRDESEIIDALNAAFQGCEGKAVLGFALHEFTASGVLGGNERNH